MRKTPPEFLGGVFLKPLTEAKISSNALPRHRRGNFEHQDFFSQPAQLPPLQNGHPAFPDFFAFRLFFIAPKITNAA